MTPISINEKLEVEKKLNATFDEAKFSDNPELAEIVKRKFVYSQVEKKKVLFVGINPSYLNGDKPEIISYKPFDAVKDYPRHYKKFQDIATKCNFSENWTYLDLLFLRETSQNKVMSFMKDNVGLEFICQQLRLSFSIIEEINPDLIVVCNKGASQFFGINKQGENGVWLGYNFERDELGVDVVTGIHKLSIIQHTQKTNLVNTPVIFCSLNHYTSTLTKQKLIEQINNIF